MKAEFTYLKGRMARNRNLAVIFALVGILLPFLLPLLAIPVPWFYASVVLWVVSLRFLNQYWKWRRGMGGERKVAEALKSLDDSYYVLHDVVLDPKAGNIDHILTGPSGVFILETKNYSGEIACEGDSWYTSEGWPIKSISIQTKRNAAILGSFLQSKGIPKWVRPVLVFANPKVKLRLQKPTVEVVRLKDLQEYITSQPFTINEEEAKQIAEAIMNQVAKPPTHP